LIIVFVGAVIMGVVLSLNEVVGVLMVPRRISYGASSELEGISDADVGIVIISKIYIKK